MRFLREFIMPWDEKNGHKIKNILLEDENKKPKDAIIKGIFAQSNVRNKNMRIYPRNLLEREVYKLQKKVHSPQRLLLDLDHPIEPIYQFSNAAAVFKSLKQDPNNPDSFIGEAKIIKDTAKGATAWGLAKENIQFGISSRALGSLKESKDGTLVVQNDLNMITFDIVSDPSAPDAWADTILEKAEYIYEGNKLIMDQIKTYKNALDQAVRNTYSKKELQEKTKNLFADFINNI